MRHHKLVAFATIAGCFAITLRVGAMAPMPGAAYQVDAARVRPLPVQYEGRPSGQPGSTGGPDWQGGPGRRGEWHGGPGWHREWPSNWGGGWYGGWFQPYWGNGAWMNPYWVNGHPDYYYGSPGLCSGGSCWQAPTPYTPMK